MIAIRKMNSPLQKVINVVLEIPANTTLNYLSSPYAISRVLGLSLSATSEKIQSFSDAGRLFNLLKDYTILQGQIPSVPCKVFTFRLSFTSKDAMMDFIEDKLQVFDDFIEPFIISEETQEILKNLDDLRYYAIEDLYDEILENRGLVDGGKQYRFMKQIETIKQNIEHENSKKDSKRNTQYS